MDRQSTSGKPGAESDPSGARAARPTSHDVARLAGVSQPTVSRAMRGDASVAEATRERVRSAALTLGYTPSEIGRSLVTRSTRTVGMVVTDLTNPFYPYLVAPLHDELADLGYRMVLLTERAEPGGGDAEGLRRLHDRSIDGVVLTTSTLDSAVPHELARHALPFVFLTRTVTGVAADSSVVDNVLGGSMVAAAITEYGHERIGAIFGPETTSTGRDRERGFRAGLAEAGVVLAPDAVRHGPFVPETGYRAMAELMALSQRPTAVFCGNDTVAIGALNASRGLGLDVPGDVSVVGFDDLPLADWEVFELTTVHQPMNEMARAAARLLVERTEGRVDNAKPRQLVFEPRLVIRRTLGRPGR